jgi:stearoyl-CoA desaturase (delta-9 desaturase)
MRRVCKGEIALLKEKQADLSPLKAARRWLHRDADKVPASARPQLAQARAAYPVLDKMVTMREELRQMWMNTSQSREQLAADLQAWCRRAEESGIEALRQFSMRLRAAHA